MCTHFNCSNECGLLLERTKDDSELERDQPNHFVGLSIVEFINNHFELRIFNY